MEPVIGIDLGTTNSCVAAVVDGAPTVFANKGGYKTTPSVFALATNGRRVVGHIAKRQAVINAENTVHAAKRLIGRRWGSTEQSQASEIMPYKLVEGRAGDIRIELSGEVISVPEVASHVLAEMKEVAEAALGEEVTKAVVTVPAYFNDSQRQATKDAGRIAGLDVIRIINEPTAAALAYGFGKKLDQQVLVFDLGGGTFDVSIMRITDGMFEVVATSGDSYLGGEDFDERVVEWLIFKFAREHGGDLRRDKMALQRIKDAAEKAKCELSQASTTEINLPFIQTTGKNESAHMQATLTREKLQDLCEDLVDRTITTCKEVLRGAGLSPSDIDEVILVGGQTRMPMVQARVAELIGRDPCKSVHPDEVVALGAAIQASLLLRPEETRESSGSDMLLLDVTPMSLGIMILKGYFQVLIPANTTVPTSASHVFTTVKDDQTQVKIMVFQGESDRAADNELLGEFILTGLRKAPRGQVEVEVTFEISADGIVAVRAKDLETGQEQKITVTATHGLTEDEIEELVKRNEGLLPASAKSEGFESFRSKAERDIKEMDRLLPEVKKALEASRMPDDVLQRADSVSEIVRAAIANRDAQELSRAASELDRCLTVCRSLVAGAR